MKYFFLLFPESGENFKWDTGTFEEHSTTSQPVGNPLSQQDQMCDLLLNSNFNFLQFWRLKKLTTFPTSH